jgi:hypothetical protein
MNYHAGMAFDHPWKKCTIQSNRRQQIYIEGSLPVVIRERSKSAIRRFRSAEAIHEDIQPIPCLLDAANHLLNAFGSADVGLHEYRCALSVRQWGACRRC